MTYQTLEQVNGTGMVGIFQTVSDAAPIFPGLILGGIFVVLAFASFFVTQRRLGRGDLSASFAAAGFVCCVIAFLMSLIPNFINNLTIVPMIILEIVFVTWLFMSRE